MSISLRQLSVVSTSPSPIASLVLEGNGEGIAYLIDHYQEDFLAPFFEISWTPESALLTVAAVLIATVAIVAIVAADLYCPSHNSHHENLPQQVAADHTGLSLRLRQLFSVTKRLAAFLLF